MAVIAQSQEYHYAHLAFARTTIVEAAANRDPILGLLREYTKDVRQAERDLNAWAVKERDELRDRVEQLEHDLAASRIGPWMASPDPTDRGGQ